MDLGGCALRAAFRGLRRDRAARGAAATAPQVDRATPERASGGPRRVERGGRAQLIRAGILDQKDRPLARRWVLRLGAWIAALLLACAPVHAAVEIAFYSRELGGNNFPHAFISLRGTIDSTGEAVDTSYGFTAKAITPAILWGSVAGEVVVEGPRQIARSDRQFALTLTEAQYHAVMAVVARWRDRPQPSYNLNRRNCVHFVAELAETVGLRVERAARLMKRPRSFLEHVRALNPHLPSQQESVTPP